MLKLKLSILFRTLYRYRLNTAISIIGFSIALACAMVLLIKAYFALTTDNHHVNYDNVYRTIQHIKRGDALQKVSSANYPLADAIRAELPAAKAVSMVQFEERTLRIDGSETTLRSNVAHAENELFDILSFEVLAGDQGKLLRDPNRAVISVDQATNIYGLSRDKANEAIGNVLLIDNEPYVVEGIISDYDRPTDYPFDVIASFQTLRREGAMLNGWGAASNEVNCYFLASENFDEAQFLVGLDQLKHKYLSEDAAASKDILIQPLSDIHFNADYSNFTYNIESIDSIYAMITVGFILIILAVINYVNLATAHATARSKEVGIRKVMGSRRIDLLGQFMSESFLITLVSLFLALVLVELCFLNFNDVLNFPADFSALTSAPAIGLFVLFLVSVTILSGYYPAVVLSRFRIIDSLKTSNSKGAGGINFRKSLIVIQYAISQSLVIITLVVSFQLDHFLKRPLGFSQDTKITFSLPDNDLKKLQRMRLQLQAKPEIENVTFALGSPHSGSIFTTLYGIGNAQESHDNLTEVVLADPGFPEVFNLNLLAGQFLDSDTSDQILINEQMMYSQGFSHPQDAIGQSFSVFGDRIKISGVIEDFHMQSLHSELKPLVISTWNKHYYEGIVDLQLRDQFNAADLTTAISSIENIWKSNFPNDHFEARILDDVIRAAYQNEINTAKSLRLFTVVAIVISSLGLFGLISFMILQRTKEVGVRRVLGANALNISFLFSQEFALLLGLGALIAIPVGYYFGQSWLDSFVYRIDFSFWFIFGAIGISVAVTLLSIIIKLIAASRLNPTQLLRTE